MAEWPLADAKNKFSELVNRAESEGPQTVLRRGEPVAVVVSIAEYERHFAPKRSLKELLLNPPDFTGVDFSRDDSPEREFEW
jgi:prevent-host-death family protein